MKKRVLFMLTVAFFSNGVLLSQSIDSISQNSSCSAGGEMWVCGAAQQNQAHIDFDSNCSGHSYQGCTIIKTVVDVCSPNMKESRIIEPGNDPENCHLLN